MAKLSDKLTFKEENFQPEVGFLLGIACKSGGNFLQNKLKTLRNLSTKDKEKENELKSLNATIISIKTNAMKLLLDIVCNLDNVDVHKGLHQDEIRNLLYLFFGDKRGCLVHNIITEDKFKRKMEEYFEKIH